MLTYMLARPCNVFVVLGRVRNSRTIIIIYKSKFTKGRMPRWTKEIFVVDEIMKTNPINYKIKDLNGKPILGSFYIQELHKTKF